MQRPYQRGSVSLHNGNWTGRYFDCSQSERVHKRVFLGRGLNKREARKKLESIIDALAPPTKENMIFAEFVKKWEPVFRSQYKQSTWYGLRSTLNSKILPLFGDRKLAEVTREDIQTFASQLKVGGSYTRKTLSDFRCIWRTAKLWGYANHDPFEGLVLPRVTTPARKYFTEENVRRIINYSQEPYKTLYWLLAQTGMRIGEALGLKWSDVDVVKKELRIERNVYRGAVQEPKSASGYRTVSISPLLAAHLQNYREYYWKTNTNNLLFSNMYGEAGNPQTFMRDLHSTLACLEIPRAGFHAFRHANATIMDKIQAPLGIRAQRMGHKNSKITLDTYTHSVDNGAVAEKFDEIIGGGT